MPQPPGEGFLSAYDASEYRPFARIVLPIDLWDWETDYRGSFTRILIHNGYVGIFEDVVFSEWTTNYARILNREGEVLFEVEHNLGIVPFVLLRCDAPSLDRDNEPFGYSALRDVSDKAIQFFNAASRREYLGEKLSFPFLVEQTDAPLNKNETETPAGPDYLIRTDGTLNWVVPPSEPMESATEHLSSIHEQARSDAGVSTRADDSIEAHSGIALAWEHAEKFSSVHSRAENLKHAEQQLWRLFGIYLDRDIPYQVGYPEEYATVPIPRELEILEKFNTLKLPDKVQRVVARGIILKQYAHLKNLDEVLEAIEEWKPTEGNGNVDNA